MKLGIVEVKSAVELATEAWIAQSHAFDVVATASAHAATNIWLAEKATIAQAKASADLFKQYEEQASGYSENQQGGAIRHPPGRGFSSFSDSTDPANFGFTPPPPGTGIIQPVIAPVGEQARSLKI